MNARQRQIAEVLKAEHEGQCPGCGRVSRTLGDHRCEEPLSVQEARQRMDLDGGLLKRPASAGEGPFDTIDELMQVSGQFDRLTEAVRCGTVAWQRLREAICAGKYGVAASSETDLTYKGIPVMIDPELDPDAYFAVSKPAFESETASARRGRLVHDYIASMGVGLTASQARAAITGLSA